jgi:hypothetical protein
MKLLRSLAALAPLGALLVGCGSLGDSDKRVPLAVLDGQLTQASTSSAGAPSNVRIAVVWSSIAETKFKVTQDVPATAVFPSKFRVELADPPPASAMNRKGLGRTGGDSPIADPDPQNPPSGGSAAGPDAPPSVPGKARPMDNGQADWPLDFAVAVGTLVAYEDKNGNGKLDLVDKDASSYVDRILGVNENMLLTYVEGSQIPASLTATDGTKPTQGYGLLQLAACPTSLGGAPDGEGDECNVSAAGWLPISTLYDLPLTAEPKLASIMCTNDGGDTAGGGSAPTGPTQTGPGPNGVWPAKDDAHVRCAPDGRTYEYTVCTTESQGMCKGAFTECTATSWGFAGTTPPAEWPCTVAP